MITIKNVLEDIMKKSDIEGLPEDFLDCMTDFLHEYAEHIKLTEPYATKTIQDLFHVAHMDIESDLDTVFHG
jgi:septation ring formation regulator EzrA